MNDTNLTPENTQIFDIRDQIETKTLSPDQWADIVNDLVISNFSLRNQLADSNRKAQDWRNKYDAIIEGEGTPTDILLKDICKSYDISRPIEPPKPRVNWINSQVIDQVNREAA